MPNPSSDNVHVINQDAGDIVHGQPTVLGFAMGGRQVSPDVRECVAKVATDPATKNKSYWLKRATNGMNAGKLYNPNWPINDDRAEYKFVKAPEDAFNLYVKFIETLNPLFLLQAERM